MKKILILFIAVSVFGCKNNDKKKDKDNPPVVVQPTPPVVQPTPPIVKPTPPVVKPPSYACATKAEAKIDCYMPHKDVSNCQYFKSIEDIKAAAELAKGPDCVLVDGEMVYNGFGPCLTCRNISSMMSLKAKKAKN